MAAYSAHGDDGSRTERDAQRLVSASPTERSQSSPQDDRRCVDCSNNELVARWQQGDEEAADELYQRYCEKVMQLVNSNMNDSFRVRVGADDMVQSVFKSAFRVTRNSSIYFEGDGGFWKWLATLALNKVYKRIQRETAQKRDTRREAHPPNDSGFDAWVAFRLSRAPRLTEAVEIADLLTTVLVSLKADERTVLQLRVEGYGQQEIAERLGVDVRTVRRKMATIRSRMSAAVDD